MLFFIFIQMLFSQNNLEIHYKFEDCFTCNLPKLNSILQQEEFNNYNKQVVIHHSNMIDPKYYLDKIKSKVIIDTINIIENNLIVFTIDSLRVEYILNDFNIVPFKRLDVLDNYSNINENNNILIDINSINKSHDVFYLIANHKKNIFRVKDNEIESIYQYDSNLTKSTLSNGSEYLNIVNSNNVDFSIFNILSLKSVGNNTNDKSIDYLFTSLDSISHDSSKNDITVYFNYFIKSKDKLIKIDMLPKGEYNSMSNNNNFHILQRNFDEVEKHNELLYFIDTNLSKIIYYSDLKFDSTDFVSNYYIYNNIIYIFNFDNNVLCRYNLNDTKTIINKLSNVPNIFSAYDHISNSKYYIQLFQNNNNVYTLNIYNLHNMDLISTVFLKNINNIEDLMLYSLEENNLEIIYKHKINRWRILKYRF